MKSLIILTVIFFCISIPSAAFSDAEDYTQAVANALSHAGTPANWVPDADDMVKISAYSPDGTNPYGLKYYDNAGNKQLIIRTLSKATAYNGVVGTATAGANYTVYGSKTSMNAWVTTGDEVTEYIDGRGLTAANITTEMERGVGMYTDNNHDAIFEMAVTVGNSGDNIHLLRPVRNPDPAYFSGDAGDYGTAGAFPADAKAAGLCADEPDAAADAVYANYKAAYDNWAAKAYTTSPFPWSQLGYTYVWGQAENPPIQLSEVQGLSEFILLGGTGNTAASSPSGTDETGELVTIGIYATQSYIYTKNDGQYGNGYASFDVAGACDSLWAGTKFQVGAKLDAAMPNTITVGAGGNISGGQGILVWSQNYAVNNAGTITANADTKKFNITDSENIAVLFKGDAASYTGDVKNTLNNSGIITGPGANGTAVKALAGKTEITNTGTIAGTGTGYSILTSDGDDTVNLYGGSVSGRINLGGGNNILKVGSNGSFSDTIEVEGKIWAEGGTLDITISGAGTLKVKDMAGSDGDIASCGTIDLNYGRLEAESAYTQASGSTLKISVAGDGSQHGNIKADSAVLGGYSMQVAVDGGSSISPGQVFKVVDAGAGQAADVTKPAAITDNSYALGFSAGNGTGADLFDLMLTVSRENSFRTAGGSANACAVGAVFDGIAQSGATGDMLTVLNELDTLPDAKSVEDAFGTVTPVVDSGINSVSNNSLNQFIGTSMGRLEQFFARMRGSETGVSTGSEVQKGFEAWAQGFGEYVKQEPRGTSNGYRATIWGTAMGGDIPAFNDRLRIGLSGGYAQSGVNSKDNSGRTDIDSYQGTLYGGYIDKDRPYYINGAFSFAYNKYESLRHIAVGTLARTANSGYDGRQYSVLLDGGYTFRTGKFNITPVASLQYTRLHLEGYTETNAGALNLSVKSENYDMLQSGLGVKLERPFETKGGAMIPEVHFRWLYDFIGDKQETTSNFSGGGGSFATQGFDPAQHSFNAGTKLTLAAKGNWSLETNYDFEYKEDFISHTGWANIRYRF